MDETKVATYDSRTLAFYGTLLGLVILDLILLAWMLSPVAHAAPLASLRATEAKVVSATAKPSPFEAAKTATPRRAPRARNNAQASIAMPAFVNSAAN